MPRRKIPCEDSAIRASGAVSVKSLSSQPMITTLPSRAAPAVRVHAEPPSGDKTAEDVAANITTSAPKPQDPIPQDNLFPQPTTTTLNTPPTQPLDFFIFGDGSQSELGLGNKLFSDGKKPVRVSRPRLHHLLKAAGVVQVACGGMHSVALTHDNRILTWGINDDKNLARDTTWNPPYTDNEQEEQEREEFDGQQGMIPLECTPLEITYGDEMPRSSTVFTQAAASSAASFVLTATGDVYGWGTFRCGDDGTPTGFHPTALGTETHQITPLRISGLHNIRKITCGSDHVLALDKDGRVWSWGAAQQGQLGRRIFLTRSRDASHTGIPTERLSLKPELINFPFNKRHYATDIAAGSWHGFLIDNHGALYGWGVNNFSQTGRARNVRADGKGEGEGGAIVDLPTKIAAFEGIAVKHVAGGQHHSVACTEDGRLWSWGKVDGHQTGHGVEVFDRENAVFDGMGRPRILVKPTELESVEGVVSVAAGTDTSFAVTEQGHVYSWGFTGAFQAGHGPALKDANGNDRDVEVPKRIENSSIKDRKIVWADAGGQFSMLAAVVE